MTTARMPRRSDAGHVMILILLLLVIMVLATLIAFDLQTAARSKVKLQTAADAAAGSVATGSGGTSVMMIRLRRGVTAAACVAFGVSGCSFGGLNSLPLPGAVGRGPGAATYHVELANVATLEPNSPVLVGDVVVGSVNAMRVRDWHADVEVSVKPDVQISRIRLSRKQTIPERIHLR